MRGKIWYCNLVVLLLFGFAMANNASAITTTYFDNINEFAGFTTPLSNVDANGNPNIIKVEIDVLTAQII